MHPIPCDHNPSRPNSPSHKSSLHCASHSNLGVVDVDGEAAARNAENGGIIKESREALGVQCGTGNQHLERRAEPGNVLDETEEDVSVEGALVSLVNDDHTAGGVEGGVREGDALAQIKFAPAPQQPLEALGQYGAERGLLGH